MTTSSLIFIWSPAGPNHSRAGRRPLSTAFTEGMANLQSPKSSPRVERADTPCSVQPTPARTQEEGANCCPASWNGFLLRYQALGRVPLVAKLRGPQESSTTSATSARLRVATQSRSLRWLLAPKPKGLIWTSSYSRPAQTNFPPKNLLVPWMVKSSIYTTIFKIICFLFQEIVGGFSTFTLSVIVGSHSSVFPDQIDSSRIW